MVVVAASSPRKFKLFAEIIKLYQNTKYSHVLLISGNTVYQANSKGVHTLSISEFAKENVIVWNMEIPEEMIDWAYVNKCVYKNIGYGYFQIFAITMKALFKVIFREKEERRLICSEFVGNALRLDWVDDFTDPEDIVTYLELENFTRGK